MSEGITVRRGDMSGARYTVYGAGRGVREWHVLDQADTDPWDEPRSVCTTRRAGDAKRIAALLNLDDSGALVGVES